MKEYTKRDSCMTMEEVIERNTGMSLKAFLTPQPNPYIHNMDRAVEFFKKKVNDAAEEKEILQIKIVGDYDADGMNASAILYDAIISYLKANSLAEYAEVSVRLPRRYSEGYGLSKKIIDESESGLIITVDNGIAAIDAIKKAKDKGIDVIILDHHLSGEELPCADIIVDPHCEGMSTFKHYCGAGLAYRFAEMLITNKDLLDKLLVLAGIATVADVVPLIGANRCLVRQSLKLINRGIATSGVLALVRKMRLEKITAEDYGYKIGPVCNASGRLLDDGAMDIFHLLSQELDVFALDYDEQLLKLHALADTVIERNVDRRRITEEALERSDALISQQCLADDAVYIIYDTQVSEGVMGIVAGKLAEKYMRPVIVFAHAQDGEKLKGSGRTYGNIHLKNQVLDPCKEYFFAYGGHAGAAGMTIPEKNLMLFRNKVRKLDIPVLYREKRILYDLEVTKEEIPELYALLAPTSNEDSMDISGEELEIMLNNIVENGGFDFVICDTGNNTRDSSYMTLLKADQVFLVLTQNFNTANCNNSLLKMLDALHFDMNKIGLIINKVQSKKSVGLGTDELEETFINPLTNKPYPCIALIKDTNDIRRASNNGEPLVYSPNNDFTKSIGKIVSQIVDEEHALEQPEKKGLFARLFGKRG